ncbi:MAG: hypothetical protein R6U68_15155 [Desulfobacteraceae bacterium]
MKTFQKLGKFALFYLGVFFFAVFYCVVLLFAFNVNATTTKETKDSPLYSAKLESSATTLNSAADSGDAVKFTPEITMDTPDRMCRQKLQCLAFCDLVKNQTR